MSFGLRGVLCAFLFAGVPAFAATTTTTLAITSGWSAVTTVASGSVVTLTATVSSGAGAVTTGLVNFCDAAATYCTDIHIVGAAQLTSAGTAVLRFVPAIGSHSYKAVFVGTNSNTSSVSSVSSLAVTVTAGTPGIYPTTTTIAQSGSAGNYTLTATVVGTGSKTVSPTGTVSFLDTSSNNNVLATAALGTGMGGVSFVNSQSNGSDVSSSFLVADVNGDGKPDLIEATTTQIQGNIGVIETFLGNGDGTFINGPTTLTGANRALPLASGDFNGDGKVDLVLADYTKYPNGAAIVLLGNGDGTFTQGASPTVGTNPVSIAVGDFNGDGNEDLVVASYPSFTIMFGNGDGTFTQGPSAGQIVGIISVDSIATADFNGDGKVDLLVTDRTHPAAAVLLGNGDGTSSQAADLPLTFAGNVVIGDFNGDGRADLAGLSTDQRQLTVLLGNGDGTFTQEAGPATTLNGNVYDTLVNAVADFNGDGKADLAILHVDATGPSMILLLGNGDGTFVSTSQPVPSGSIGGVTFGDVNGDGMADVAITYPPYGGTDFKIHGGGYDVFLSQPTLSATATVTGIAPVGTGIHQVAANYPGDSNYDSSVSAPIGVVTPTTTTLTLVANPTSSSSGQQIVLTVTLSPYSFLNGTSDGELVFFYNGGIPVAQSTPLKNGVATLNITSLPLGVDNLYANYNGDTTLEKSTSNTVPVTVQPAPTLTFVVPNNHNYGDAPFSLAATSNSDGAITYSVVSGPATISGSTVTLTGAGVVVLQASVAATSNYGAATKTATLTLPLVNLYLSVNNTARIFGAANPVFTGTITGAAPGDTFTETFTTTATPASIVGSYPIVPSVTGSKLNNYYVVVPNNGTLTVSQAGTATTLLSQTRT